MKLILSIILGLLLSSFIIVGEEGYIMLYDSSTTATYYQYGNNSFLEHFLDQKEKIGNFEYYVRIRKYSNGKDDTAFFRKGENNYYHFNKKLNEESILLPRVPLIGNSWVESDSSWTYTVLKINEKFKTPVIMYKNCVVIECKQLTGRDLDKSNTYFLYYSKGNGFVGSVNSKGRILSFLKEKVENAQIGTKVGGK